jgi:hypothetical protein
MLEVSRGVVLSGEESSSVVQRIRVNRNKSIVILLFLQSSPWLLRRFTFHKLGSLAVFSRRRWQFEQFLCRLSVAARNIGAGSCWGDVWRHA